MSPSPFRAVILDWAGTVIDHGCFGPIHVFVEAFAQLEVPVTIAEARVPMGQPKWNHLAAMLAQPRIQAAWQERFGRPSTNDDVDALYERFLPLQAKIVGEHAELIPGALEAIDALRARGMRIGSTTGYPGEITSILTPLAAAAGYAPECVIDASSGLPGRPAPWIVFEAMRRLDVYPPSAVVVVDDTGVGVASGKNAGARAIGIAASGNGVGLSWDELQTMRREKPEEAAARIAAAAEDLRAAGADVVIDSIAELPAAIASLEG